MQKPAGGMRACYGLQKIGLWRGRAPIRRAKIKIHSVWLRHGFRVEAANFFPNFLSRERSSSGAFPRVIWAYRIGNRRAPIIAKPQPRCRISFFACDVSIKLPAQLRR